MLLSCVCCFAFVLGIFVFCFIFVVCNLYYNIMEVNDGMNWKVENSIKY